MEYANQNRCDIPHLPRVKELFRLRETLGLSVRGYSVSPRNVDSELCRLRLKLAQDDSGTPLLDAAKRRLREAGF